MSSRPLHHSRRHVHSRYFITSLPHFKRRKYHRWQNFIAFSIDTHFFIRDTQEVRLEAPYLHNVYMDTNKHLRSHSSHLLSQWARLPPPGKVNSQVPGTLRPECPNVRVEGACTSQGLHRSRFESIAHEPIASNLLLDPASLTQATLLQILGEHKHRKNRLIGAKVAKSNGYT